MTSSTKGLVRLTKKSDSSAFLVFEITGVTDVSSSYWQLTISNLAYSGTAPFNDADDVLISFVINGDKGDTEQQVPRAPQVLLELTGPMELMVLMGPQVLRVPQEPRALPDRKAHRVSKALKEPREPPVPQERLDLKVRRALRVQQVPRVLQVTLWHNV